MKTKKIIYFIVLFCLVLSCSKEDVTLDNQASLSNEDLTYIEEELSLEEMYQQGLFDDIDYTDSISLEDKARPGYNRNTACTSWGRTIRNNGIRVKFRLADERTIFYKSANNPNKWTKLSLPSTVTASIRHRTRTFYRDSSNKVDYYVYFKCYSRTTGVFKYYYKHYNKSLSCGSKSSGHPSNMRPYVDEDTNGIVEVHYKSASGFYNHFVKKQ